MSVSSHPSNQPNVIIGALFMSVIGLIIVGVLGYILWTVSLPPLTACIQAQRWVEVPATIESVELITNHASGSDSNSKTYRVAATYTYRYEGNSYQSDRVASYTGSDNIGSYHHRVFAELKKFHDEGEPFRCYVNPNSPDRAYLYRDFRYGFIFVSIFVPGLFLLFGGFLCYVGVRTLLFGKHSSRAQAQYPDQPWKWDSRWASGRIVSSMKTSFLFFLLIALFLSVISFLSVPSMYRDFMGGNKGALLGSFLPLMAIGFMIVAIRKGWQHRKYGESVFTMTAMPGVIGGRLEGVVTVNRRILALNGFQVNLSCLKTVKHGKNSSTHCLWGEVQTVDSGNVSFMDKTNVPISITIPASGGVLPSSTRVRWPLTVKAETEGVDYEATFEVPVFRTDAVEKTGHETACSGLDRMTARPEEAMEDVGAFEDDAFRITPARGGLEIQISRIPGWGQRIMLFTVMAVFGSVSYLLWGADTPFYIFPIIFTGLTGILLFAFVDAIMSRTVIVVNRSTLTYVYPIWGIGKPKEYAVREIQGLDRKKGATVTTNSVSVTLYDTLLHMHDGRTVKLTTRISGEQKTRRFIALLSEAMGMREGSVSE